MSYRFLLSRRWLILTLVALALVPGMIRLGFWQLDRHEARAASNERVSRNLAAESVPVDRLTRPDAVVPPGSTWRAVTATGHYDLRHEVVARQRTAADGQKIGYHVITPLVLDNGTALLVNRGWIPPGEDITTFPTIPKAPSGEVTITGRLRPDETTRSSGIKDKNGMPARQVMLINSARLAKEMPYPLLGGYVELTSTSPRPQGAQPQEIPEPDDKSVGVHLAYAVQWWLFAALVPVGWVILARREHAELAAEAGVTNGAAPPLTAPTRAPAAAPVFGHHTAPTRHKEHTRHEESTEGGAPQGGGRSSEQTSHAPAPGAAPRE